MSGCPGPWPRMASVWCSATASRGSARRAAHRCRRLQETLSTAWHKPMASRRRVLLAAGSVHRVLSWSPSNFHFEDRSAEARGLETSPAAHLKEGNGLHTQGVKADPTCDLLRNLPAFHFLDQQTRNILRTVFEKHRFQHEL